MIECSFRYCERQWINRFKCNHSKLNLIVRTCNNNLLNLLYSLNLKKKHYGNVKLG